MEDDTQNTIVIENLVPPLGINPIPVEEAPRQLQADSYSSTRYIGVAADVTGHSK